MKIDLELDVDVQAFEQQFQWLLNQGDALGDSDELEGLLNMMGAVRDTLEAQGAEIQLEDAEKDVAFDSVLRETTEHSKDAFVRDWYMQRYPTDDLGPKINPELTFRQAFLRAGEIYDALGVGDSIVRERVFDGLSKHVGVDYNVVYERWMNREVNHDVSELSSELRSLLADEPDCGGADLGAAGREMSGNLDGRNQLTPEIDVPDACATQTL